MAQLRVRMVEILHDTEGANRRRHSRYRVDLAARIRIGPVWSDCRINEMSLGGAEISAVPGAQPDVKAVLEIPAFGPIEVTIRRASESACGLEFRLNEAERDQLAAFLDREVMAA